MNLTSFSIKASAAAVACTVGVMAVAGSAEAIQLKGAIGLDSFGGPSPTITNTSIKWGGGRVTGAEGDFGSLKDTNPVVKDLLGLSGPSKVVGPIEEFINFGSFTVGSVTDTLIFNLDSATFQLLVNTTDAVVWGAFDIVGTFEFGGQTVAKGLLNAQTIGNGFSSSTWGIDLVAKPMPIPTPALLPGLVGMGVAALRRKQGEESVEENA